MQNEKTVGVIGLGLMGEVLATRLMAAGFAVRGTDIDPAKNARLASRGGEAVASAAGGIIHRGWNVQQALDSFAANRGRDLDFLSRFTRAVLIEEMK